MRALWLTDLHLGMVGPVQRDRFFSDLRRARADSIWISGDIAEAPLLGWFLGQIAHRVECPVYFVLGNHDYYMGSFASVASAVRKLIVDHPNLCWLTDSGVIEIAPGIALAGHDGWADGRAGDYLTSDVELNDYRLIEDLSTRDRAERLRRLNALGDAAAARFRTLLEAAFPGCRHLYLLTHVPPFAAACAYQGQPTSPDYLPHYCSQSAGEALLDVMRRYPDCQLTVLCGHTHEPADVRVAPNLRIIVGAAEYGHPVIQRTLDLAD